MQIGTRASEFVNAQDDGNVGSGAVAERTEEVREVKRGGILARLLGRRVRPNPAIEVTISDRFARILHDWLAVEKPRGQVALWVAYGDVLARCERCDGKGGAVVVFEFGWEFSARLRALVGGDPEKALRHWVRGGGLRGECTRCGAKSGAWDSERDWSRNP